MSENVWRGQRFATGPLTLLRFRTSGRSPPADDRREALVLGLLIVVMIMASPVCHLHYFGLTVPLAAGLLASQLERNEGRWPKVFLVLGAVNFVGTLLPLLPGMDLLRDHGSAPFGTLLFWGC